MTYLVAAILATANAGETVVLDFHADWCGPCKMMDPAVKKLASKGYPIRKVDIEERPDLAQRYGVRSIPCFVVLVNGKERGRKVGMASLAQLEAIVNRAGIQPAGAAVVEHRGQSPDRIGPRLPWARRKKQESNSSVQPPLVELGQPTSAPWKLVGEASVGVAPAPATAAPARNVSNNSPVAAALQPRPATRPSVRTADLKSNPLRGACDEQQLLAASVRLRVEEDGGYSFGSGTIIDFRPVAGGPGGIALVLTCGHVLREAAGKDSVLVDSFNQRGSHAERGRIVHCDLKRDVGLVSFQTSHPVPSMPLAPANVKVMRGDRVVSIGCDHGRDPSIQRSHVMAINNFVGPENLQVAGQPAVGRSGGGLFNKDGYLVGICNFADPTDRAGLYAAVELAHAVIEKSGWHFTGPTHAAPAKPPATQLVELGARSTELTRGAGLVARGQQDDSLPNTEVICIVRRNGNEEIIVIKDASPNLLQQINEARKTQRGAFPTSMETRRRPVSPETNGREIIYTTTDWQPNPRR
jgi:thioredoxin